jgi:hypothetical protein
MRRRFVAQREPDRIPCAWRHHHHHDQHRLGRDHRRGVEHAHDQRIRYELDCNANFALGVPCTDQGDIMAYVGDASILSTGTACNTLTWTSNVPAGGSATNEIIFTPSAPIVLPANTFPDGAVCALSFQVKLDNLEPTSGGNSDPTPTEVEVVAGYSLVGHDAVCDNGGQTGASTSGFIEICPACTGDNCDTSTCNTTTGACDLTPINCDDNNACTTDTCDPASGCVHTPVVPCSTTTTTTTLPAATIDHFECYKAKAAPVASTHVSLANEFETTGDSVIKVDTVCVPVDKNGEGIPDPSTYLTCYKFKADHGQPRLARQTLTFTDQFGARQVVVVKGRSLCVPSAKTP